MVPQYFIRMDEFPLNANNKLDRKSLLPPEVDILHSTFVAPTNATEKILCDAFCKVLHLEKVGIDDDFIRLGGDSVRIMQVQKFCSELELSSKIIYKYRTPRQIAFICQEKHE